MEKIFSEEVLPLYRKRKISAAFLRPNTVREVSGAVAGFNGPCLFNLPIRAKLSLLEAMSVGCAIVASNTCPLSEAIEDNVTGKLFDFFSHNDLATKVTSL